MEQTCCGQPAFNSGYRTEALALAERFINVFEGSEYVVAPSGSCTGMVRVFFPDLFKHDPEMLHRAQLLASSTYEFTKFLINVLGRRRRQRVFEGKIALHQSCHLLRELDVRTEPERFLKAVRGMEFVKLEQSEVCCGWGTLRDQVTDDEYEELRKRAKTDGMSFSRCVIEHALAYRGFFSDNEASNYDLLMEREWAIFLVACAGTKLNDVARRLNAQRGTINLAKVEETLLETTSALERLATSYRRRS